jgi:1-acyl-sn-glycerol-3-phosphate acyltransferase
MAWTPQLLWYHFVKIVCRTGFTFGFHLKTEGKENIPTTGPCLLLCNHESFLDPPMIGATVDRSIYYLARSTLWKNPYFGALLTSINTVPVNQNGPAHEGLRTVINKLNEQQGVLLFPEGSRTETGQMAPLQPGIVLILRKMGFSFPIIPVGIAGAFEAWPLHHKLPYLSPLFLPPLRKGPVAISFGKPVDSQMYQGMERGAILDDLYNRIHAQVERAELIKPKPLD